MVVKCYIKGAPKHQPVIQEVNRITMMPLYALANAA